MMKTGSQCHHRQERTPTAPVGSTADGRSAGTGQPQPLRWTIFMAIATV